MKHKITVIEFRISREKVGDSVFEFIRGKLFLTEVERVSLETLDGAQILGNKGYIASLQNMIPLGKNELGFMSTMPSHIFIDLNAFLQESLKVAHKHFENKYPLYFYNKEHQLLFDVPTINKIISATTDCVTFLKSFNN